MSESAFEDSSRIRHVQEVDGLWLELGKCGDRQRCRFDLEERQESTTYINEVIRINIFIINFIMPILNVEAIVFKDILLFNLSIFLKLRVSGLEKLKSVYLN